jgi:hypothetical protein
MIITNIMGGLGNQLFQYATGKRLADKHGVEHKIDITGFEEYKLHAYSLGAYTIDAPLATAEEIASLRGNDRTYISEDSVFVDPRVLSAGPNTYLRGHWQSERYFSDIRDSILTEFTLRAPLNSADQSILSLIRSTAAVALHIRRMDFATNANHGLCDLSYYDDAIARIAQSVPEPTFFIFSDDPTWVKANLKTNFPCVYVDHNDASRNYADLYLMSQCQHFIIANSTFSWWGAWMSTNAKKIIIAPKQWFRRPIADRTGLRGTLSNLYAQYHVLVSPDRARDLVPKTWIRI